MDIVCHMEFNTIWAYEKTAICYADYLTTFLDIFFWSPITMVWHVIRPTRQADCGTGRGLYTLDCCTRPQQTTDNHDYISSLASVANETKPASFVTTEIQADLFMKTVKSNVHRKIDFSSLEPSERNYFSLLLLSSQIGVL